MRIYIKKLYREFTFFILVVNIFSNIYLTAFAQESAKYADTLLAVKFYSEPNVWGAGFFGGLLLNSHFVDFHALPTVPSCCPEYKTGYGTNLTIGGFFDYKILYDYDLFAQFRVAYANIGGTISAEERELMYYSPTQSVLGLIEHTIETSIHSLWLQPGIKFGIYENTSVRLGFSINGILSTSFEQKETLVEPKDLTFENDSRVRMNYGGKIPGVVDVYSSISGGINYDIPLNKQKDWFLSPELFVDYDLNKLIPKEKWNVLTVGLALAINYRKGIEEIERFEQFEQIDTIKIELPTIAEKKLIMGEPKITYDSLKVYNVLTITEKYFRTDTLFTGPEYLLTASIKVTALEENGNEIKSPNIQVEEFLYSKMKPMLNYVFFDSNSYKMPDRYKLLTAEKANEFNLNKAFTKEELGFYHNILNVIGYKLRQNSDAKITLIGHNYNLDAEKNNLALSQNRAQAVKDYLTNIWQIKPERIIVQGHNLPESPSNNKAREGHEENRRVEIVSDNFRITSSLIAKDTVLETTFTDSEDLSLKKLNFGGFRLYTDVTSDLTIKQWKLSVIQGNDTIKTFEGSGQVPLSHDWIITNGKNISEILAKPIQFVLTATDIADRSALVKEVPKVDVKTIALKRQNRETDLKRDSYSMMLFEFGSARFTEENKDFPIIIRRLLNDKSKVNVIGYSDSFGNDNFNLRLSTQRAKAVSDALNHPNTTYQGVGETMLLYSNDTPEGRFYCRTVDIISETPIHW